MPHRLIPSQLRHRLGRRGAILALFGLIWLLMGIAYLVMPELAGASGHYPFWHERLNPLVLAAMWGGSGIISISYGFLHKNRNDTNGFLAVCAPPMVLSTSFLTGAVTRVIVGDPSWVLGVIGFLIYGIFALALAVIASWPDVEGVERD